MKTVWKHHVDLGEPRAFALTGEIVHAACDSTGMNFWSEVSAADFVPVEVTLTVVLTGAMIPESWVHVESGITPDGLHVGHLYEVSRKPF